MKLLSYRLPPQFRFLSDAILAATAVQDNWQSLTKCDVLLVCHDNDRGYTYQNQAYAQLLDSLGDLIRQKGCVIQSVAQPFSRLTQSKAYGKPVVYNRERLFIILQSLVIRLVRGPNYSREWAERKLENLWHKILVHCSPTIILAIQPDSYICRSGHAEGIAVYDLQHGLISAGDPWYVKRLTQNARHEDLPSGFLCWDMTNAATLEKWTEQKGIAVHIVGNPWFRRFLSVDGNDLLVQEALALQPFLGNERPTILVSLQGGMAQHFGQYVTNGVMPDALEKTILNTAKSYNWLLRLHPSQIRGSDSEMVQHYLAKTFGHLNRTEWQQCSEVPLPIVLKWSNLHITYSSATTTEAAWMGVYTGLLDPEICLGGKSSTYYSHERRLGIAETLPLDSLSIETWIESTLIKGKANSTLVDSNATLEAFISKIALQSWNCDR
ncbi:hypothetical protein [Laspinema olomoucense]|uniref:hypothetical protein n=1 Tax=Laspinema olomoucense TaxID=3231600 RepID=UPI0021BAE676|nr:hypothetical protein [Laspinema sp. D3c]MCT7995232.1 hypothetical protein [Laspinema sp. D3c]